MRTLVVCLLALGLWLNWDRIDRFFDGEPAVTGSGDVILYATSWCGYCRKTRELFDEQGVAYVEYDIEKSDEGRARYDELGGNGVPVIDVRGTIIHGYDEDGILAALH
ncbi:MAG TPA: glutaredoxin family protein [Povalibacter sp.]|uniref:glutaredoxin family protein n=1 Tax=Povalibacter sp. TaxID=1962978 RepID=UPI002B87E05E|nr:glutaredoxin family protein [Povalibacter sp.]HMN45399.1 glutaredoxin family protein [Povalibacter sp.]